MATCTYTFKDQSGKSVTLAGIPALKTYLVMGAAMYWCLIKNWAGINENT